MSLILILKSFCEHGACSIVDGVMKLVCSTGCSIDSSSHFTPSLFIEHEITVTTTFNLQYSKNKDNH